MYKTIKAIYFEDEYGCYAVEHVYKIEDDDRRYTDFYVCGNEVSAQRLVKILER